LPGKLQCEYYDLGGEGVAFHETDSINSGSGKLNPADGSYLHELGHHLEHSHISVGDMARKFYEKRTAGKKLVKMKELDPYGKYDDQEYGRDDTFISKYTGKIYEDGYTEIISMGLEHLYRDPVEFRLKDPEHFELIIKALRLLRHESQ
ncbi:MAG: hypothetical protein WCP55_20515, partial [Lentisphaerota bacterium]